MKRGLPLSYFEFTSSYFGPKDVREKGQGERSQMKYAQALYLGVEFT